MCILHICTFGLFCFRESEEKKNLQLISQMRRICLGFVTFFLCLNKICHEFIVKFALIAKTWRFFFRKNLGEKNDYLRFNGSPCHRYNVRENKKKTTLFHMQIWMTLAYYPCCCPFIFINTLWRNMFSDGNRHVLTCFLTRLLSARDRFVSSGLFFFAVVYSFFSFVCYSNSSAKRWYIQLCVRIVGAQISMPYQSSQTTKKRKTHTTHTRLITKYSAIWSQFAQLLFYMNIFGNYSD